MLPGRWLALEQASFVYAVTVVGECSNAACVAGCRMLAHIYVHQTRYTFLVRSWLPTYRHGPMASLTDPVAYREWKVQNWPLKPTRDSFIDEHLETLATKYCVRLAYEGLVADERLACVDVFAPD